MKRFLLLLLLFALTATAGATTIVMPDDGQLVAKSPLIVVGQVSSSTVVDRGGRLWTESVIDVTKVLRGELPGGQLIVREVGGTLGERATVIFGVPQYRAGERVLAFLTPTPRGDYQTVDMFVGKFTERTTLDGQRSWFRDHSVEGTQLLDRDFRPLALSTAQRDAALFERYVAALTAGAPAEANYGITNPRYSKIGANFTLIDEPRIYRWFAFDSGEVPWRSVGTQAGYSNGGVTELRTGMQSWTGYTGARIRYNYAGTAANAGGLNTPNGTNEVLFGDPLGEISGSWNNATGGVVGVGGFNSVSSGGNWTAPFTADPTHQAGTFQAWQINEGNLVIQDGVAPGAGIGSSMLAEILAHEFGHTLGFGHSQDASALMYFQVTGLGPSLRADDQNSARWLYPASSGPAETVPQAPSNLVANLDGDKIQLSWADNAGNETLQTIYVRIGNGSFGRYAEVAANIRAAVVTNLVKGQTYRFRLTASNSAGESAPSNIAEVIVPSETPVAAFTVTPINGIAGVTNFTFSDTSSGAIASRVWTFGDGGTSTLSSPTHVYLTPGTYTVKLVVASAGGLQSSATRSLVVTAPNVPPTANFSYTPSQPSIIDTINFIDETIGNADKWSWTFGDGGTSSLQNPTRRYPTPGTYEVVLTASGNGQSSTVKKFVVVTSGSGGSESVSADFDLSPAAPKIDDVVTFIDRSAGSPNSWFWDFGDGFISTLQNPTHKFTKAGEFTVSLTAGNRSSSSAKTKTIVIRGPQTVFKTLVPVAAETEGASGSSWRTELTLFNPGDDSVDTSIQYLSQVGAVPATGRPATRTVTILPKATLTYDNALRDLFGVTSGAAALSIEATQQVGAPQLRVSSRTFTGSNGGTYGQYVPDCPDGTSAATAYVTGLVSNPSSRSNIGFVNDSQAAATVQLFLIGSEGTIVSTATLSLPKGSLVQQPLTAIFPGLPPLDGATLKITSTSAAVHAYASIVDNTSQDPIFISAIAPPAGTVLIIPAAAKTAGSGTTFWRSDVTLFNSAAAQVSVTLKFLVAGADNRAVTGRQILLPSGHTVTINDVVSWLGGGASTGAVEMTWTGDTAPVVSSRTYTTRSGDTGTFGQSIAASPLSGFSRLQYVTGLRSDPAFRTNIGFVNREAAAATAAVVLLRADGTIAATTTVTLQPKSQLQFALSQLFTTVDASTLGSFTIRMESPVDMLVYGSVVDNRSGDPIFVAGR
jgi:PKD repeat protein